MPSTRLTQGWLVTLTPVTWSYMGSHGITQSYMQMSHDYNHFDHMDERAPYITHTLKHKIVHTEWSAQLLKFIISCLLFGGQPIKQASPSIS